MNYQEFVGSVTGFLRESLPGGTRLQLIPLEKNNGIIMDGLSVRKEGKRVAPMIYLDSYYREYLDGRSLRGICDQILECCEDSDFEEHFDVDFFREPERVRPTVAYRLINYEKNRELLQEIPHLPFLDLAVIFYSLLTDTPVGHATVLIRNSHLELWGKNTSWLYEAAKENTEKLLPKRLVSMEDMIYELSEGKQEPEYAGVPMYVLTNSRKSFGAACLLYDGVLGECFRRLEESYYLIPSSVHEVILIPASAVGDSRELCALVQEMNRTQVRSTEVLSDTVYLYSEETRRLEMIDF
ncbi:DUF5688 family protein [Laedolimicola intestinihominis]|uniref:DUF5688 family protein n=1 Tax=Laedolimicola intestinihominis TaxID=3133166 RepID=A0ABV1FH07_9FIRM